MRSDIPVGAAGAAPSWRGAVRLRPIIRPVAMPHAAGVLLVYIALAVVLFRRAWTAPSAISIGDSSDPQQFMWFLGWAHAALLHLRNPLISHAIDYPGGVNLMWNTSVVLPGLLLAPLTGWLGPVITYNLLVTLALPLSAWCAYLALRRWVMSGLAAAVGGLLYGFSPYMMGQSLAHPQMILAWLPPLVLLLLHELLLRRQWPALLTGGLLGLLAAAQLLTGEEILATTALATVVALLALLAVAPRAAPLPWRHAAAAIPWRRIAYGGGAAAIVFGVLAAVPLYTQFLGPRRVPGALHTQTLFATDLLNFIVPSWVQWLAPGVAHAMGVHFRSYYEEQNAYLGLPMLALLLYCAVRWRREALVRWAALVALMMAILSLGPRLLIGGAITSVPLPWALIACLPLLGQALPNRLTLYVYLMAALLLAFFLDRQQRLFALDEQRGSAAARRLAAWGVAALALLPLLPRPSLPVTPDPVPRFFSSTAISCVPPGSVALVAPFPPYHNRYNDGSYNRAMLWQAMTQMRFGMPEGYAFVAAPTHQATLNPPPSVMQHTMVAIQQGAPAPSMTPSLRQGLLHDLATWKVRTIITGPMGNEAAMLRLFTSLLGRPPWHGGDVYVWWNVSGQPTGPTCDLD